MTLGNTKKEKILKTSGKHEHRSQREIIRNDQF